MSQRHREDRSSSHGTSKCRRDRSRSRSRSPQQIKDEIKKEPEENERRPENVGLGAKNRLKSMGIQMKLNSMKMNNPNKPKLTVASAFNNDSDDEPEQMPPEARMRMRNIGRDTPTSSGPNTFGKTKQGFSDIKKVFEKNMKEAMNSALADD
ncbi:PEST proteolytic signal-containing nuclear protein [Aethina tumida]|uniref:PEST proteolytic signal-containing nuclear protein n=1 Tax=Aethina tumida TaxID=116153 RepID=UPI00096B2146|nr:PEST proteolytic signal-containing nuclear protein [Aethina tumida]